MARTGQGSLSRRLLAGVVLVGLLILLNLSLFGWLIFRSLSERFPASYPVFETWQDRGHPFEDLAAYID